MNHESLDKELNNLKQVKLQVVGMAETAILTQQLTDRIYTANTQYVNKALHNLKKSG